ncbi:hypothetical protein OAY16_01215 [Candidatus Pelagibacter sp.]|nr:hypothetical protein [Candidatus Pelagibacter sp.]
MIKKVFNTFSLLILLFFLNGCGFKPILSGSDYNFLIQVDNMSGDGQINSKIKNKLKVIDGTKRLFKLSLNSIENKNILSKDSKGDPKILELVINLNYQLSENGEMLINRSITQRSSYNNISDKFELSKSEDVLKDNLIENLVSDIINSATNFMINDN